MYIYCCNNQKEFFGNINIHIQKLLKYIVKETDLFASAIKNMTVL